MTDLDAIATRFAREAADHTMTVLHDDGLYRHLRFRAPANSFYWFELITVPGTLIFRGDGDSYVFHRLDDMFEFFRGQRVNPGYWTEKLTSGRDQVKRYERSVFMAQVHRAVDDARRDDPTLDRLGTAVHDSLAEADEEGAFDFEEPAREWLRDFQFWADPKAERGGRYGLVDGKRTWIPQVAPDFEFSESWEWDLRDYDWWVLWSLHAIVWGIASYDRGGCVPFTSPVTASSSPSVTPVKAPAVVDAMVSGGAL